METWLSTTALNLAKFFAVTGDKFRIGIWDLVSRSGLEFAGVALNALLGGFPFAV
jgi:hypothetical protein